MNLRWLEILLRLTADFDVELAENGIFILTNWIDRARKSRTPPYPRCERRGRAAGAAEPNSGGRWRAFRRRADCP